MHQPKRSLLRFSLGALLLMTTMIAVWLGFQIQWKDDRANAIVWIEEQAVFWADVPIEQGAQLGGAAPFPLSFMGAPGLKSVCVVVAEKSSVEPRQLELERMFPEAEILVCSPGTGYQGKHASLVRH